MPVQEDVKTEKLDSASIYLDKELKAYLSECAKRNQRGLSAEIVFRLWQSKDADQHKKG